MDYVDIYDDIYSDAEFQKQLTVACLVAADNILDETPIASGEDGYDAYMSRITWCTAVLDNPLKAAIKMMPSLLLNSYVQAGDVTDARVLSIITNNLERFATVM